MLFNSTIFIFVFLPLTLVGFYLCARIHHTLANAFLVLASLIFYGWWDVRNLPLLVISIIFNFAAGIFILKCRIERMRSLLLFSAVSANLAALIYFKYAPWLLGITVTADQLSALTPQFPHLVKGDWLPLGISFFTFTQIGYLIDARQSEKADVGIIKYALFATYFPHLIAGPIIHHKEIVPQFERPSTYCFKWSNLSIGISMFAIGLAKKVIIADNIEPFTQYAFDAASPTTAGAWIGVLSYSMQLYFDFSGYSEMALGISRMFGILLPINFNSPYKASSIIEFWQRWHITLTRYITLFVYNPVAMSIARSRISRGKKIGRPAMLTLAGFTSVVGFPIALTMFLAGVWHGAGFQFIAFGVLHAAFLIVNHAWRLRTATKPSKIAIVGSTVLTFLCVLVAQVFFRAHDVSQSLHILGAMAGNATATISIAQTTSLSKPLLAISVLLFIVFLAPNALQIMGAEDISLEKNITASRYLRIQWRPSMPFAIITALIIFVSLLLMQDTSKFLYFQF